MGNRTYLRFACTALTTATASVAGAMWGASFSVVIRFTAACTAGEAMMLSHMPVSIGPGSTSVTPIGVPLRSASRPPEKCDSPAFVEE
ncbi:unannotated protein [freshwater metagenome]|uniref:Unannotated protein n=1 Tax=freshwater metagenome TaxID=449393 RepID=A0A6J7DIV4_9ZZZZ